MAAENNDSPSTLQQYLDFTATCKRFEPGHNLFTFPLVHSIPLKTTVPIMKISSRAANNYWIMGKAQPSSHARSYIPNTVFLWLIIQFPENVTFDPSVTKPISARKTNASLFRELFFGHISLKPLLQETISRNEILKAQVSSFRVPNMYPASSRG